MKDPLDDPLWPDIRHFPSWAFAVRCHYVRAYLEESGMFIKKKELRRLSVWIAHPMWSQYEVDMFVKWQQANEPTTWDYIKAIWLTVIERRKWPSRKMGLPWR